MMRKFLSQFGVALAGVIGVAVLITGVEAQNPGVQRQGAVANNDCVAWVNNQLIKSTGGTCAASSPVQSVFGRTGNVTAQSGDYGVAQVTGAAPLASPTFTGTPAAPTAAVGTATTQIATTAFVAALGSGKISTVADLTAQKAFSITGLSAGYVLYRAGFASPSDGGQAFYTLSTSTCTIASGAGDNGAEVLPNSGTGCWILSPPSSGVDLRVWGGLPNTNVNDELQAALDWACTSHIPINVVLASDQYVLTQAITIGDGTSTSFSTCNGVTLQGVQPFSSFNAGQLMAFGWGGAGSIVPFNVQGPIAGVVIRNIGVDCFDICSTGFRIDNALESEFDWLSVNGNIGAAYIITSVTDNNQGAGNETSHYKNLNAQAPGTGGSGAIVGDISCAADCNIAVINARFDNLSLTYDGQTAGTFGLKLGMITQSTFVRTQSLRFNNLGALGNSIVVSPPPGALGFPANLTFYDLNTEGSFSDTAGWAPVSGITIYGFSSVYSGGTAPSATTYGNIRGWMDTGQYFPYSNAWTPTDASGAGLTLTTSNTTFYRVGSTCIISFNIVYPVTADGSAAAIQLPAACSPRNASPAVAGGAPSYTDYGSALTMLIDGSNGHMLFYSYAGAGISNALLSGKTVRGSLAFAVN